MISLSNLKPTPGARRRSKRVGCGESSGHGKTSGRGHKGQKARSGGSIRLGFEGGQMPLIRKMPKRGFSNAAFKLKFGIVNLQDLRHYVSGVIVDEKFLRQEKLIRGKFDAIKILGTGEINMPLTIVVDAISASAREKVEKAGGIVKLTGKLISKP